MLVLIILITLPGYAAITLSMIHSRGIILHDLKQRALAVTHSVAKQQNLILEQTTRYLTQLASLAPIQTPDAPTCSAFLKDILQLNPLYINVGVPLKNGDLKCNALPLSKPVNVKDRPYFQAAINERRLSIGQFQLDRAAQTTSINFAYPVINPVNQDVKGAVVAVISLSWWSNYLKQSPLPPHSIAMISDQDNTIVATYPETPELLGQSSQTITHVTETSKEADHNHQSHIVEDVHGIRRIFYHEPMIQMPNGTHFTLSLGIGVEEALNGIENYFYVSLASFSLLMGFLAYLANNFLLRSVINPIKRLITATQQLREGVFESSQQYIDVAEVDQLHQQFEKMAQRRLEVERVIRHQANTDALTGLANRHLFLNHGERAIQQSTVNAPYVVLLFIDLDNFKEVNDSLGHDAGDQLLKAVAERLNKVVESQPSALVARQGGDEFTIILSGLTEIDSIPDLSYQILNILSRPLRLGEHRLFITVSIGVAIYPDDATNFEDLMKSSDQAMFSSKQNGKSKVTRFTSAMKSDFLLRTELSRDMHSALHQQQFQLFYQPIVDQQGLIVKAEALIRWHHPRLGFISPAEFIPIAERSGLIISIGEWVFQEASQHLQQLKQYFHPDFQVSVNMSPVQLAEQETIFQDWHQTLETRGLKGRDLVVEITEGVMMTSSDEIKQRLLSCRELGIELALDDFGTGYSSLAYIRQFEIDYLKIDRSFVDNLEKDGNAQLICEAMISIAHKLKIKVVAEGVEEPGQAALLKSMGCDYFQGYMISKPIPIEDLLHMPNLLAPL